MTTRRCVGTTEREHCNIFIEAAGGAKRCAFCRLEQRQIDARRRPVSPDVRKTENERRNARSKPLET